VLALLEETVGKATTLPPRTAATDGSTGPSENHLRWRNDREVAYWATGADPRFGPVTRPALVRAFEMMLTLDPLDSCVFTVEDVADGRPIGMADYRDLDPFAGRAAVGLTVGEREYWGRGYGSEALQLLVRHIFEACRLHRIELETWSGNQRAVRAFVKGGFLEEGRRRESVLVNGRRYDRILFGLLRKEWNALR
jgi:RimJ/RimL family protein N-acetyltransferase